ncbi:MAG: polyribonucleotide nucleotidyltransferase [Candidatus Taylorbacteria bacterium RIFCSPLOWO2_12_FULL_43_20]|uniref:Polyribonucleotide nucleotidyltransferase n=1 Tax=Candidatus Taylorbacteria bacterium RIFCSPLOWO2_12_FULL_43_20 TaxID=1802332 RepID=A0A1G2P0P4_9BACT|nr:MAG: polyribonucleotide nucleotidyltransferase [Candidatus Taylorbacteria bacterium RIFCSPHIGHO2_01_FULL_43_120]OHA22577.1 MAG: polyribonucleotide nucleotidyltransferase [Candidatus Taylorbacteria bacterium RIFCSPHIGHO2_02_FULL_43_55]OHA28611.1 MAG: polyribonucleotide nucleotidyltransferase [Candidatus Taylorbacteria bacterium RIFCSPHIGHO2_12_FULL_42_34]OHA30525.1 MAG: polyribonucleotide nucleotidyltransferase [Candidatus Taylorbacteria bacterium RIFCSPLOWO2_01_FULL_43_83]OHA38112.1 MAG: pol
MQIKEYSTSIGGKTLTAMFTDLAERAHGSVMIKYGNTVVLATAVMSNKPKEGGDYFPLTVEYEEKFYASGKILGSRFIRREGRPSDEAVLSGRIVDRTIRPLFPQYIRHEVQVIITILSIDEDDPDVLGVLAASLALGVSDIPWNGPASAIRIGKIKDEDSWIINPTYAIRDNPASDFELVACGKDGKINMIELGGREAQEESVTQALEEASKEIEKIQEFQNKIISEIGKPKRSIPKPEVPESIVALFKKNIEPRLHGVTFSGPGSANLDQLKNEWMDTQRDELPDENGGMAAQYFEDIVNDLIHKEAIENERRPDGRKMDELRPLYAQAGGLSPVLHGSGIFYRGGTHILSALTLGGPGDSQVIEGMEEQVNKRFMHHYNFPPFSVGETGRVGGMNRRMIGHGALAEKALKALIPDKEVFPYTIRIVSEALSSNGSTSMGSVCASSLALMDAGVPIKKAVAGIASGLMMGLSDQGGYKYKILMDIQGPEDHHGDMDFKVAGTRDGITAIQMDVKVEGIPVQILKEAFDKAKAARLEILAVMDKSIDQPRADISPRAPKILIIKVKVDQIGLVIGPGGKTINGIKDKTGVEDITIEEDGTVFVTGKNGTAEKAMKMISDLTREYKKGEKFEGEVTRIMDFGAFVKIGENTEGLVHISEIASFRVDRVDKYLKEGDKVPVIIKEIDEKKRINLSIKEVDPNFVKRPAE